MKKQNFTKEQIREWMLDSAASNGNWVEIHSYHDFETGERIDIWYIIDHRDDSIVATETQFRRDMERGWH